MIRQRHYHHGHQRQEPQPVGLGLVQVGHGRQRGPVGHLLQVGQVRLVLQKGRGRQQIHAQRDKKAGENEQMTALEAQKEKTADYLAEKPHQTEQNGGQILKNKIVMLITRGKYNKSLVFLTFDSLLT